MNTPAPLVWLGLDDPFPALAQAWPGTSAAPGLLACGADLSVERLLVAYGQGIFPWFSPGQPICWFHTDPRMVLRPNQFKLHHALDKKLRRLLHEQRLSIQFDENFEQVMRLCASTPRAGQSGSWIGPEMIEAYTRLHQRGQAFCLTARIDAELVGGLYAVVLGRMVYGESMFSRRSDGSKLALAALVAWARHHELPLIDAQQDTVHLRSLGGLTLSGSQFLAEMTPLTAMTAPERTFSPILWAQLWPDRK